MRFTADHAKLALQPRFVIYAIGHIVSVFGDIIFYLSVSWLIYERTESASAVALGAIMEALPILVFGTVAGPLVDRVDRRVLLLWSDSFRTFVILLILLMGGRLGVPALYVLILAESAASTVFMPARSAMLPTLVPRASIPAANAILGFTRQWVQVLAWGAGGVLLATIGFRGVSLLDVGTFAVSFLSLVLLGKYLRLARRQPRSLSYGAAILEGLRYAWGTSWIRTLLVVFAVASLASAPLFSLTPVYVNQVLNKGSRAYGLIQSALMAGLMLGNVLGGALEQLGLSRLLLTGLVLMGAAYGLAAQSRLLLLGMAMYLAVGMAVAMVNLAVFSLLQTRVPNSKQGRVFSLLTSVSAGATPLTLAAAGPVCDRFGLPVVYMVGGALVIAVGVFALWEGSLRFADSSCGQGEAGESIA